MCPLPDDLREELQKEYAASFDEKLRDLQSALKSKDGGKLAEIFHKLAGSGKTYEMDDISVLARKAEDALKKRFDPALVASALINLEKIFKNYRSKLGL